MKKEKKLGAKPESKEVEVVIKWHDTETGARGEFRPNDIGPAENLMCRQATNLPVEHFLADRGTDSLVVSIWLGRVQAGERVTFHQVLKEYGTNAALARLEWSGTVVGEDDDDEKEEGEVDPTLEEDS